MKNLKVKFVTKLEDGSFEFESMWCNETAAGYYEVDNIPFVVYNIALGDTVKVEYDEVEECYYFDDFVTKSGNSTVRICILDFEMVPEVREELQKLGCDSEVLKQYSLISVNVPKQINYIDIRSYLDKGEAENKWTYEESCLRH